MGKNSAKFLWNFAISVLDRRRSDCYYTDNSWIDKDFTCDVQHMDVVISTASSGIICRFITYSNKNKEDLLL